MGRKNIKLSRLFRIVQIRLSILGRETDFSLLIGLLNICGLIFPVCPACRSLEKFVSQDSLESSEMMLL